MIVQVKYTDGPSSVFSVNDYRIIENKLYLSDENGYTTNIINFEHIKEVALTRTTEDD